MKKSLAARLRKGLRRWLIAPKFHMRYGRDGWPDEVYISDFQGDGDIACDRDLLLIFLREIQRGGELYEGWAAYRQDRKVLKAAMAYLDKHSVEVTK